MTHGRAAPDEGAGSGAGAGAGATSAVQHSCNSCFSPATSRAKQHKEALAFTHGHGAAGCGAVDVAGRRVDELDGHGAVKHNVAADTDSFSDHHSALEQQKTSFGGRPNLSSASILAHVGRTVVQPGTVKPAGLRALVFARFLGRLHSCAVQPSESPSTWGWRFRTI